MHVLNPFRTDYATALTATSGIPLIFNAISSRVCRRGSMVCICGAELVNRCHETDPTIEGESQTRASGGQ